MTRGVIKATLVRICIEVDFGQEHLMGKSIDRSVCGVGVVVGVVFDLALTALAKWTHTGLPLRCSSIAIEYTHDVKDE